MTDHRFQGYGHPELYNMINSGPGVSASIPVERSWKQIAATLAQIDGDLHQSLAKMGADWESDAGAAAQGALSPLAEWAGFAEQGATTMESSARLQGEYIADARKKMPEVVPVTTEKPGFMDIAVGALTGPVGMAHVVGQQVDHERQEAAADNAAAQAVKVMEDYQSDSRWNSSTLGEFPTPPQVVIDTPPPGDTGTGSSRAGYTSTGVHSPSGNTGTTTPSWTPPPAQPPVSQTWTPPGDTTNTSWAQPPSTPPGHTPTPPPTNFPQPTPQPTPTPHAWRTGVHPADHGRARWWPRWSARWRSRWSARWWQGVRPDVRLARLVQSGHDEARRHARNGCRPRRDARRCHGLRCGWQGWCGGCRRWCRWRARPEGRGRGRHRAQGCRLPGRDRRRVR
ncbi:PPE domain-containing protein [Lentzea sp. PSKA42]|uniref:PPE domain-containing protein n=1 Tax=Lentzea indica TaxID=2604800 RepID=A0ABX1FAB4_9PSEU|nr:PPE domain-containing protein [Lentzea indica]NKE55859.1 PPE domain-containing protein [Lentzea indica]